MTEPEPQDTNQKIIRSIVKGQGKKNSQRSVSFRGIDIVVEEEKSLTAQKLQRIALTGMVRLLAFKATEPMKWSLNQIKQHSQIINRKHSKVNLSHFSNILKQLANKRLSSSFNLINKQYVQVSSSNLLQQKNDPRVSRSVSVNNKMIKRSQGADYYNTQSHKSLNKRPSFRSNDSKSVKSTDQVITKQQCQNLMCLSEQAKKVLLEMQRFDRFIYVMESQKRLKVPIQAQLKRLQKIKNHYKCMRDTYYDNQLTITCLYNHMKNMYEMNRDLGEIVKLKAEIERLEKKIIENNMKHTATLKQLKVSSTNAKLAEDAAALKQHLRITNSLSLILKDQTSSQKTKNQIQTLIKNTPQDKRELLCLVQSRISSSDSNYNSNIGGIFYQQISKLLQEQNSADKNIKNMQKIKKGLANKVQQCTNQQQHQIYQMLINLVDKLNNLYTISKSKQQSEIVNVQLKKLKSQREVSLQKIKQLESKLSNLAQIQSSIKNFQEVIGIISGKIQTEENYLGDVVKNKRILSGKKLGISKLFCDILGLFEILNKGDKKKQLQSTQSRIKQLQQVNKILSEELSHYKTNPQTNQFNKFIGLFPNTIQLPQFTKIIKYIEINKKKLPTYQPLLTNLSSVLTTLLDNQKEKKRLEGQTTYQNNQKQRQLTNMEQIYINIIKLLQQNNNNNTNNPSLNASKIKKMADSQLKRSQISNIQYQFNPLYHQSLKALSLISQILQNTPNQSLITKSKEQSEKKLKSTQNQFGKLLKSKEDQIQRLKLQIQISVIKYNDQLSKINQSNNQINRQLQDRNRIQNNYKYQIDILKKSNQQLQRQINQSKVDTQIIGVLKQQSQQLKTLKVQMAKLKNESQQLNKLRNESMEMSRLKQQNQQLARIKSQNQEYQRSNTQLRQFNQTLSNQISQLQSQLQSRIQLSNDSIPKHQYNQLSQQNENLSRQISQLKNNISSLNSQLQVANQNNSNYSKDSISFNNERQRLNQQISNSKREIQSLQITISKLNQQIQSLKIEIEYKNSSLNIPRHSNHHIQVTSSNNNKDSNKERYYQQLYQSSKAQNQQLRYQLAEVRSKQGSSISRPSIISSMNYNQTGTKQKITQYAYKIESYQKQRNRFIDQINNLNYQKQDLTRSKYNLQRQIDLIKSQTINVPAHSVSPSHSQLLIQNTTQPQTQSTRLSSHVVIKSDNSSIKIQQLQKQIRRLNQVIKDTETKNINQINKIKSQQQFQQTTYTSYPPPQIITSSSPRNSNTMDILTRQKHLESQNKRLLNQINIHSQKQRQLNDQSMRLNQQLRRYQDDSYSINTRQNNIRRQLEESEIKNRKQIDSHKLQINYLNQSIKKLATQNTSLLMTIKESDKGSNYRRQGFNREIEDRKNSQTYLQQKIKSLESANDKLNRFVKQLQIRCGQLSKELEKVRSQNISLRKGSMNQGTIKSQGGQFINHIQDKFSQMVMQKSYNLQKIQTLQSVIYTKQIKLSKLLQSKQSILRQMISQLRKTQLDLKRSNQTIKSDKLYISSKNIDTLMGKFEVELLDTIKQKAQQNTNSLHLQSSKRKRHSLNSFKSSEFIENNNIVLHNLLVFLISQKWLQVSDTQLPQQSEYYFEQMQKFLIDLFQKVFEYKNEILDKQAHQLLMLRQKMQDLIDQQISQIDGNQSCRQSQFDIGETKRKASIIALQHIFKLYLKTKSPQLLKEILNLLHIEDE